MKISIYGIREKMEYPQFRNGFKVLKVSEEEAMRFTREKYREYAKKCAALQEGENYRGYVIFYHGRNFVEVGYIEGALVKITDIKDLVNSNCPQSVTAQGMDKLKAHLAKGWSYKVVKGDEKGVCLRVQTFGGCDFSGEIEHLQNVGLLQPYVEPEVMEQEIRAKLVTAAVNWQTQELHISRDEELVLTGFFGYKFWLFVR